MNTFFVPGKTPSSKNSRLKTRNGAFIASKATREWQKATSTYWVAYKNAFLQQLAGLEKPYKINFKYVRGTKHVFDYVNPQQTVQDEMVHYGWLEDDNADILIPVFEPYEYSKTHPGVYITVIK